MVDYEWKTIGRVGFFGKKRDKLHKEFDEQYGIGKWRLTWNVNGMLYPFEHAILLYEDAYYRYFLKDPSVIHRLTERAGNVYDNAESNINSGYDYSIQETDSNHYQDIAVRRCVLRWGLQFQGYKLVQIRHDSEDIVGALLSPGYIEFHRPNLILEPHLKGWWEDNSVECFWQSNKTLQSRD